MQTWDLLRLMYYGFKGLCDSFIRQHGQYYGIMLFLSALMEA